jgi:hypothetical protein
MHCRYLPAWWVGDQHRHAIGRARSDTIPCYPRNESVAFSIGDRTHVISRGDLPHDRPVYLSLLEEAIARELECLRKARAVLGDRFFVVT